MMGNVSLSVRDLRRLMSLSMQDELAHALASFKESKHFCSFH